MTYISPRIQEFLAKALDGNIDNYSVRLHDPNKKGEGYLGELSFISVVHKSTGEKYEFVVKQAFTDEKLRKLHPVRTYFLTEIYFYTKVWSRFKKFQDEKQLLKPFDKIPKCFAISCEENHEKLVLENLRYDNFQTYDKKLPFDKKHFEYVFKQYGKFHAVSFAYKLLYPEEYAKLSSRLKQNELSRLPEIQYFREYMKFVLELCMQSLDELEDVKVMEKFKRYVENGPEIFSSSCIYKGDCSVILHGDCWCNNMMFKYNESTEIIDMKLIDFQFSYVGSPVSDLAYCMYSGGSKEVFDDLDHYLKLYHDQLLESLEEFGCCSKSVLSFEELKNDWKQYCKTATIFSLMLWRVRLTCDGEATDLNDICDDDLTKQLRAAKCDEETFSRRCRELILHLYQNVCL